MEWSGIRNSLEEAKMERCFPTTETRERTRGKCMTEGCMHGNESTGEGRDLRGLPFRRQLWRRSGRLKGETKKAVSNCSGFRMELVFGQSLGLGRESSQGLDLIRALQVFCDITESFGWQMRSFG